VLWRRADEARRAHVGDAVHLRGLVEISNYCVRQCAYCGLRAGNRSLPRYRMSGREIVSAARQAAAHGCGTVVLQAGEDPAITAAWMASLVRRLKADTPLAVTLSLGERAEAELAAWREAGADRYLLRFETSDRALYEAIHPGPGRKVVDRIGLLRRLRRLGYEVGGGIMVGLPGQTYASIANDIRLFRELDLDMIGIGPYIPHPETPLGAAAGGTLYRGLPSEGPDGSGSLPLAQVPNSEEMVYKVMALARLARPDANIPSTTALATINRRNGRELGLQRGANVLMPNVTPLKYRRYYQIYPGKACLEETGEACHHCLRRRLDRINRPVARGPGGRRPEAGSPADSRPPGRLAARSKTVLRPRRAIPAEPGPGPRSGDFLS
jgi:biotin synthase